MALCVSMSMLLSLGECFGIMVLALLNSHLTFDISYLFIINIYIYRQHGKFASGFSNLLQILCQFWIETLQKVPIWRFDNG